MSGNDGSYCPTKKGKKEDEEKKDPNEGYCPPKPPKKDENKDGSCPDLSKKKPCSANLEGKGSKDAMKGPPKKEELGACSNDPAVVHSADPCRQKCGKPKDKKGDSDKKEKTCK